MFSQASKARSHRSRHSVFKPLPLQHRNHKNRRRSVTFASPVQERYIAEDSVDDIFETDDDDEHSESESFFLWDEESTLLDDLMDKPKMQPDDNPSVLALTESLRNAFVNRGHASKTEMAHIFVSINTEVKTCFEILDDKVEPTISKEIVKFNTACKNAERKYLRTAELIEKFEAQQAECNRLEEQIRALFAERDALYPRFEAFIENTLNPVLDRLHNLPARNERWMTQMFNDLKALDKKYKKIASSKDLQGYLGLG